MRKTTVPNVKKAFTPLRMSPIRGIVRPPRGSRRYTTPGHKQKTVQFGKEDVFRLWIRHRILKGMEWRCLMNRDELDGRVDQVKGKVKKAVGDLTDDERLHDEGAADEAAGNVQEGFGRARRKVGEAIEDIGEDIKR